MAILEKAFAGVTVGTSSQRTISNAQRVSMTDAKAYWAAADQTARDATKVGLLLDSLIDMTKAAGTNTYKGYYCHGEYLNDGFVYPPANGDVYGSNKLKVTYQTTNDGFPVIESTYIAAYETDIEMESDGVTVNIGTGASVDVENYIAQLLDTGVSSFGTAITSVISITTNDS